MSLLNVVCFRYRFPGLPMTNVLKTEYIVPKTSLIWLKLSFTQCVVGRQTSFRRFLFTLTRIKM